jgi:hypothetical protein
VLSDHSLREMVLRQLGSRCFVSVQSFCQKVETDPEASIVLTNIIWALLSVEAEIHHGAQRSRQTAAKLADRLPLHVPAVHGLEDIANVQTSCSAQDQRG